MSERSASPSSQGNFPFRKTKKIKKRRQELSEKISQVGQSKITQFFRSSQLISQSKIPKPSQLQISSLQRELNQLRNQQDQLLQQIETLKDNQIIKKIEYENYIKKSQKIVSECLCSIYTRKRFYKSKKDPNKGIFHKGQFLEGQYCFPITQQINKLKDQLEATQQQNIFKIKFLREALLKLLEKQKFMKEEVRNYKEQIKLSIEEANSVFSGVWPCVDNRYQTLELLGKGGFSEVYKAYDLENKMYVALKLSCLAGFLAQNAHYITRQYQIHQRLSHPNIAKLYEYMEYGSDKICIIIQLCEGPQLSKYLQQKQKLSEREAKHIIKQIIEAIYYLSTLETKVIHYDLKPQNIIFHKGTIKILDFGLCKQVDSEHSRIALTNQGVGTYWYLPPEAFNDKNPEISNKVDIWSIGVIFYEMLYGKKPFGHNLSQKNVFNQGVILKAFEVEFPRQTSVSEEAKQFIKDCLAYNPMDRLNPSQANSHPYFK